MVITNSDIAHLAVVVEQTLRPRADGSARPHPRARRPGAQSVALRYRPRGTGAGTQERGWTHAADRTERGRRLRRRCRPGRPDCGPPAERRPGARSSSSRHVTGSGAGSGRAPPRVGSRWTWGAASSVPSTTSCGRWPRRWGSPSSPPSSRATTSWPPGGRRRRYRGDIPRINPVALLERRPGHRPHERHGEEGAARSALEGPAGRLVGCASRSAAGSTRPTCRPGSPATSSTPPSRACFAADLSEVSLLNWLFLVRASGGVEALMSLEGGYQDSQFEGGVGPDPRGHGGGAGGRGRPGRPGHRDRPERGRGRASPPTRCGSGRAGPCWPCPVPWPPASASSPRSRPITPSSSTRCRRGPSSRW